MVPVAEVVKDTVSPYVQSLFVIVKVGRVAPERRYGGRKTSTLYSWTKRTSSGSEPETRTRPSCRSTASEW